MRHRSTASQRTTRADVKHALGIAQGVLLGGFLGQTNPYMAMIACGVFILIALLFDWARRTGR